MMPYKHHFYDFICGNGDYRAAHLAYKHERMGSSTQISGKRGDHFMPIQSTMRCVFTPVEKQSQVSVDKVAHAHFLFTLR